jgi:hypothetical protein
MFLTYGFTLKHSSSITHFVPKKNNRLAGAQSSMGYRRTYCISDILGSSIYFEASTLANLIVHLIHLQPLHITTNQLDWFPSTCSHTLSSA